MTELNLEAIIQKEAHKKFERLKVIKDYIELGALTLGGLGALYGTYWASQYFSK